MEKCRLILSQWPNETTDFYSVCVWTSFIFNTALNRIVTRLFIIVSWLTTSRNSRRSSTPQQVRKRNHVFWIKCVCSLRDEPKREIEGRERNETSEYENRPRPEHTQMQIYFLCWSFGSVSWDLGMGTCPADSIFVSWWGVLNYYRGGGYWSFVDVLTCWGQWAEKQRRRKTHFGVDP